MGFEQQSWDLSLKAGIGVSGPGFESQGQDLSLKAGIWASTVRYQFQKEGGDGQKQVIQGLHMVS